MCSRLFILQCPPPHCTSCATPLHLPCPSHYSHLPCPSSMWIHAQLNPPQCSAACIYMMLGTNFLSALDSGKRKAHLCAQNHSHVVGPLSHQHNPRHAPRLSGIGYCGKPPQGTFSFSCSYTGAQRISRQPTCPIHSLGVRSSLMFNGSCTISVTQTRHHTGAMKWLTQDVV